MKFESFPPALRPKAAELPEHTGWQVEGVEGGVRTLYTPDGRAYVLEAGERLIPAMAGTEGDRPSSPSIRMEDGTTVPFEEWAREREAAE